MKKIIISFIVLIFSISTLIAQELPPRGSDQYIRMDLEAFKIPKYIEKNYDPLSNYMAKVKLGMDRFEVDFYKRNGEKWEWIGAEYRPRKRVNFVKIKDKSSNSKEVQYWDNNGTSVTSIVLNYNGSKIVDVSVSYVEGMDFKNNNNFNLGTSLFR